MHAVSSLKAAPMLLVFSCKAVRSRSPSVCLSLRDPTARPVPNEGVCIFHVFFNFYNTKINR